MKYVFGLILWLLAASPAYAGPFVGLTLPSIEQSAADQNFSLVVEKLSPADVKLLIETFGEPPLEGTFYALFHKESVVIIIVDSEQKVLVDTPLLEKIKILQILKRQNV